MHNITWIDDDFDVLAEVLAPLRRHSAEYHIAVYRDFNEARAAITDILQCDLVLLDILGPALEGVTGPEQRRPGLQFLRDLRGAGFSGTVLIFTVLDYDDDIKAALEPYQVSKVVRKAIRPSALKEIIDDALESMPSRSAIG